ncbi:hypothetical protein [Rufibacter ruber]|uniref:hypothetical protein n=1 Tax=Rufibacter ruber TaxID=1783499 RepID=UPI000A74CC78|nr:hypothetical protein [Rufibacter ruber]
MNPRKESEIFSDLAKICTSPGYIHAIAYFCFRDNTIKYRERITTNEVLQQFTPNRLIRTEISTIIGLACTKKLNTELPAIKTFENYLQRTEELLEELHHSMMPAMADILKQGVIKDEDFNPFRHGTFLREPIFYSGEGAYHFQYREFSKLKYIKDDSWFINNKGYSIEQAIEVIHAIHKLQNNKLNNVLSNIKVLKPQKRTFLPGFIFSIEEIKNVLECKVEIITNVIKSFTLRKEITNFLNLDDYNPINAYPIIKLSNDNYLLFQNYSLMQALYETPFFWLHSDEKYRQTAMQHRGEFTEGFSTERLKLVFGEKKRFYQYRNLFFNKGSSW